LLKVHGQSLHREAHSSRRRLGNHYCLAESPVPEVMLTYVRTC